MHEEVQSVERNEPEICPATWFFRPSPYVSAWVEWTLVNYNDYLDPRGDFEPEPRNVFEQIGVITQLSSFF